LAHVDPVQRADLALTAHIISGEVAMQRQHGVRCLSQRRRLSLIIGYLVVACSMSPTAKQQHASATPPPAQMPPPPPPRMRGSDIVALENTLPGDPNWGWTQSSHNHEIEGYADHVSAKAGQPVQVMASGDTPRSATWRLYRIGWYGGAGMRDVFHGDSFALAPQPSCPVAQDTGLVRCSWKPSFSFQIAPEWVSGLYLVQLIRDDHFGSYIPLVITDDRPSDLLFQASVNTYEAYNEWGGASLYHDATGKLPWGRAVEASFDRPYAEGAGSGDVLRYERYMAQFLEQHGYDVSYTTNLDVAHGGAASLKKHGAFLSVGHDEYWSKAERDALEQARDAGLHELYFGANTGFWQVRFADDPGDGNARRMIGWKELAAHDPVQGAEVTTQFRSAQLGRPENSLLGVMYDTWSFLQFPLVVAQADHFLFRGTGLNAGDSIPWLVGYEEDRTWDNGMSPPGLSVATRTPVVSVDGLPNRAESSSYRAASGALVFASGTMDWSLGLSNAPTSDPRVERMTANVLQEALGFSIPPDLMSPGAPAVTITGPFASSVATVATQLGPITSVATLPDGSFAAADTAHHRIIRIGPAPARTVSVIAGDGKLGSNGWTSPTPGAQCEFARPTGLVADAAGNLFVADTNNHCVREILNDASSTVVTLAGRCGQSGFLDASGQNALFAFPMGLALVPATGDVLVADSRNNRIRLVNLRSGATRSIGEAGAGKHPLLDAPTAVAVDSAQRIYAVSSNSFTITRLDVNGAHAFSVLTTGTAGASDGTGAVAGIGPQQGLVWDGTALLVSDAANGRIRRVAPGTTADDTQVTTFAGDGHRGLVDGSGQAAQFGLPLGLAMGPGGVVYVADAANQAVRVIQP
jgi:sugar lactone lactonase YvrE